MTAAGRATRWRCGSPPSCKLTIEETLEELDGVDDSDVDLPTRTVTVAYDPDTIELAAITAAIEEAGYTVEH